MKLKIATEEEIAKHYMEFSRKRWFKNLLIYMTSGPIIPMIWEGFNAVKSGRQILSGESTVNAISGTIRGDFCIPEGLRTVHATDRNICHGSDSVEAAMREISLWFNETEIVQWTQSYHECEN